MVEGLLREAVQAERQTEIAEQFQYALDNRLVIERAVGLLMGREDLDQVGAFNRLRQAARSSGRKVDEIAQRALAGERLGPAPRQDPQP